MDYQERTFQPSPLEKAGFLSKLFFVWTLPILRQGRKVELGIDNLYQLPSDETAQKLGDKLQAKWEANIRESKLNGRKPSLVSTLFQMYGLRYLCIAVPVTIEVFIGSLAIPFCVRFFIKSFQTSDSQSANEHEKYLYGAGIIIGSFYSIMSTHLSIFYFYHMAMHIRVALSTAIYRKVLRLTHDGQNVASMGHIINLFSSDLHRFDMALLGSPHTLGSPLVILICGYVLWAELGWAAFAGVGVLFVLGPIQFAAGLYSTAMRKKMTVHTDDRAKIMGEVIGAMRVIKMYAWEKPFAALIRRLRRSEMTTITTRLYLRVTSMAMYTLAHRLVLFATLVVYLLTGQALTAEKVFFVSTMLLAVVNAVIQTINMCSAELREAFLATTRVQDFLLLDEETERSNQILSLVNPEPLKKSQKRSVAFDKLFARWTSAEKQTLSNINFLISGNKLLMIVGEVGSGKTSLLNVLLGELATQRGSCTINGQISYASQEPWIFSGTVRQNVIFGRPYDEAAYAAVIEACALGFDLKNWEYGDMTRVGERGVMLSGGQKARINLARAVYANSNICLLDDILSAVDAKVSRHIFEKCIMGTLRDNLRILVTHQLQYLPYADHIIVLENGGIQAQGTYAELREKSIPLFGFNKTYDEFGSDQENEMSEMEPLLNENKAEDLNISETAENEDEEEVSTGRVSFQTYWKYFRTADSLCLMVTTAIGFLAVATATSFCDYLLAHWTNAEDLLARTNKEAVLDLELNLTVNASDSDTVSHVDYQTYLSVYTGSIVLITIGLLVVAMNFFRFGLKIGVNMHDRMFRSLVRAPIEFYDKNPSGRIMNRFIFDTRTLDELLSYSLYETIRDILECLFIFLLIAILNPILIIPTLLIFGLLWMLRQYYIPTSRALKRVEATTKSPCLNYLTATYQGLSTVRALRAQTILTKEFYAALDVGHSCWYLLYTTTRWFAIWVELIIVAYLTIVIGSFCVFPSTDGMSGTVGLAVSSALMIMGNLQYAIRQSASVESYMTSVERLLEYVGTPPEALLESKPECKPLSDWPHKGQIQFNSVSLSYGDTLVLNKVSFEIKPRQKIGIVGRTGAGKSSLVAALFRMVETDGDIYIDGVRVQDIGLHDLRQSISIIPQDPQLFSGTVRYNLDPFNKYEDSELWQAIEQVELKGAIPALDFMVLSCGSNFSVGQRQLICLARAMLRRNTILVSDEATANVDERTDALIQATIRERFEKCTIITIAHRLNTVMDCDKILVLDNGSVMEFDEPSKLLKNRTSYLSLMAEQTGKENKENMCRIATKVFKRD